MLSSGEGGHLEHLPGSFRIARGDDRGMDVEEAPLLEKAVDRPAHRVPDAGDRAERVRPGTQMGDFPEELEGVAFFLQRIFVGGRLAKHLEPGHLQLGFLVLARRGAQLPDGPDARAGSGPVGRSA